MHRFMQTFYLRIIKTNDLVRSVLEIWDWKTEVKEGHKHESGGWRMSDSQSGVWQQPAVWAV